MITDKKQIASIFNDYFVNLASDIAEPVDSTGDFQDHPSVRAILENDVERTDFGFSPISTIYIEQLLKEIKVNKSSASLICFPLCSIFNDSIAQCNYPKNWKKGQVTPLFKKDNGLSKTNYRPISVLPAINNIFEKLLASQLQAHFDGIPSDYLSAYRRSYSCQTALLRMVEDWKDSLDNNRLVATISIDLSKAFDSLPHALLLAKLRAYGLNHHTCHLLKDYLQDREQRVKIGDTYSPWLRVKRGVPQGSTLGPLLFNIFINDLFLFVKANLNIYADDQQIYDSHEDLAALHLTVQNELDTAVHWYKINGLKGNPEKFQVMILGETSHKYNFKVGDIEIKKKYQINLLGVNLDSKLTFSKHVSDICDRVNNQLKVIKRFRNIVSSNTKTSLYKAFIMPYFLYCSNVWHFCGAGNARKLELLNKQALRLIFDDNNNTYETLLNNLNMTTLQTRRIQDMLIMVYKALPALTPAYITSLLILRRNTQGLRGINKLYQPRVNTTNYGKNSFKFTATKYWNILTDKLRTAPSVTNFRKNIKSYIF